MNHMKYKGYLGSVEYDDDDSVLSGKIEFINDLVSYEAETITDLRKAFKEAVEEYLEDCRNLGRKPDATFRGSFNVRVSSDLHRDAAMAAKAQGISLNSFVSNTLLITTRYGGGRNFCSTTITSASFESCFPEDLSFL